MEESESVDRDYGGVVKEDESGWKLYYSEEGYPYYYNESTGDSRWAEYDESSYSQQNQPQSETWYDQNQYEYKPQASPGKTYDPRFHSEYRVSQTYETAISYRGKKLTTLNSLMPYMKILDGLFLQRIIEGKKNLIKDEEMKRLEKTVKAKRNQMMKKVTNHQSLKIRKKWIRNLKNIFERLKELLQCW